MIRPVSPKSLFIPTRETGVSRVSDHVLCKVSGKGVFMYGRKRQTIIELFLSVIKKVGQNFIVEGRLVSGRNNYLQDKET